MTWTILGKVPHEGDFVRLGARTPLDVECFEWIAGAVAPRPAWVRAMHAGGTRFVFPGAHGDRALIGVMIRSCDRVGRDFPLAAVHPIARPTDRSSVALPVAWTGPLLSARRALDQAASRTLDELVSLMRGAPVPTDSEVQAALVRCTHALQCTSIGELHERLFDDADGAHYAYHAMRAAARAEGPHAPAVLAPLGVAGDLVAWLELARRLAPGLGRPTACVWNVDRAAIAHGELPPAVLPTMHGHDLGSASVWPLSTASATARERARAEIAPLMPPPGAPVLALIDALARRTA